MVFVVGGRIIYINVFWEKRIERLGKVGIEF